MGSGVGALVVAAAFLAGLTVKERDNRFCVACHLHEEKFGRLIAVPARDLAGLHHQRKAAIGCIACHGGADPAMHARILAVAGVDTLRFLVGAYAEPTRMRLRLRDAECRQCHTPIRAAAPGAPPVAARDEAAVAAEAETEGRADASYHAIREHETVRIACSRCHPSHATDAGAAQHFIARARVRPICHECHREL